MIEIAKKGTNTIQTLYLNNSGSKWIFVDNAHSRVDMSFMLMKENGIAVKRKADYFESFGNFASVEFRIKGLRYGGLFESFERIDGLPVLRRYSRRSK